MDYGNILTIIIDTRIKSGLMGTSLRTSARFIMSSTDHSVAETLL